MTSWYNPALLAKTGFRAAVSTVVGEVADNRELQAALNNYPPIYDHSGDVDHKGDLWIDYVADLGDGFDATHAIACAINQPSQNSEGQEIPRAGILIMGGDEVYPEPTIKTYAEKTVAPWNTSSNGLKPFQTTLYALPGNHDWYDGLHAFSDVFFANRYTISPGSNISFACHKTKQTRSYFALKLSQGWWLCGIDIQLNDRIDAVQADFFRSVSGGISESDRIILCAPTPSWVTEAEGYKTSSKLLASIGELLCSNGGKLRLILCGDVHHYSRYNSEKLTLITSGGGGAFLHPTHKLPMNGKISWQAKGDQEYACKTLYPTRETSKSLSYQNLKFFLKNPAFSSVLGAIYMLLAWFLVNRQGFSDLPFGNMFHAVMQKHKSIGDTVFQFFNTIPKSPEFALVVLIVIAALISFNIAPKPYGRVLLGLAHALMHFFGLILIYCIGAFLVTGLPPFMQNGVLEIAIFLTTIFVLGSLLGGLIFGTYLIFALNVLGWQRTNAFSSLRIGNFKNFLRMKIDAGGALTIYAFGIDNTNAGQGKTHLIEKTVLTR